jgi:hypothetical protein
VTPPRPFLDRVRDTFVAPRRLCAGLRDDPRWADALLLATAVAVIAWALQPAEVFLEQMRNPVSRMGEPVTVTSSPAEIVRYGRYMAMLSSAVGHPIVAFALAGVLTLAFSILGGGAATFRQYLAVVSHALLIPAAGTLVVLAVAALGGGPPMPLSSLLGASVASGSLALRSLAWLDPFVLWMVLVLAVGAEQLDGRRSWGSAAAVLVGLYLVSVVARAATI